MTIETIKGWDVSVSGSKSKNKTDVLHASRPSRRHMARFWAVLGLYEMEVRGAALGELLTDYTERLMREGLSLDDGEAPAKFYPADRAYFSRIVGACVRGQARVDGALMQILQSQSWPLARLDAVLRALLRVAAAEFLLDANVPARVVINESVELAKHFFDEGPEVRLVNAVLDKLAQEVHPDEFSEAEQLEDAHLLPLPCTE